MMCDQPNFFYISQRIYHNAQIFTHYLTLNKVLKHKLLGVTVSEAATFCLGLVSDSKRLYSVSFRSRLKRSRAHP